MTGDVIEMPGSRSSQPARLESVLVLRDVAKAMRTLSKRAALADGPPLDDLVALALELVPRARWASVTMLRRGRFSTEAATDEVAVRADALQYEIGAGPCVDSVLERSFYVTGDVAADPRWVSWGRRVAAELGVRSVLAERLHLGDHAEPIAALNLYSPEQDAFDDADVGIALVLATHAAAVVSQHLALAQAKSLTRALQSNREIGVAMGILMEQEHFTRAQAFDVLRVASQDSNRKLSDIAMEVADTGVLQIRRRSTRQEGDSSTSPPAPH